MKHLKWFTLLSIIKGRSRDDTAAHLNTGSVWWWQCMFRGGITAHLNAWSVSCWQCRLRGGITAHFNAESIWWWQCRLRKLGVVLLPIIMQNQFGGDCAGLGMIWLPIWMQNQSGDDSVVLKIVSFFPHLQGSLSQPLPLWRQLGVGQV